MHTKDNLDMLEEAGLDPNLVPGDFAADGVFPGDVIAQIVHSEDSQETVFGHLCVLDNGVKEITGDDEVNGIAFLNPTNVEFTPEEAAVAVRMSNPDSPDWNSLGIELSPRYTDVCFPQYLPLKLLISLSEGDELVIERCDGAQEIVLICKQLRSPLAHLGPFEQALSKQL